MKLYKSYMFRSKEPVIDETRTMLEDHFGEKITRKMLRGIERDGGPTTGAMAGWFFGKTRRPTNAAIEACGRTIGYQRKWVKAAKA